MAPFFRELKSRAQPTYVIVCESIHSVDRVPVTFLDLLIEVVVPKLIITASQSKPLTPLCPSSAHNHAIHKSWPKAVAKRIYTLSGSSSDSVDHLVSRYTHACAHPMTISLLHNWNVAVVPSQTRMELKKYPFVMRYHPCFKHAFEQALLRVPPPLELQVCLMPGWKNALPSLLGLIQSAALNTLKRENGSREGLCFLFSFRFPNLLTNTLREFNFKNLVSVLNAT